MQYNKSLKTFVVFLIIVLLLTSSFVSIGISTKTNKTSIKKPTSGSILKIKTPSPFIGVKKPALSASFNDGFNISENVVISNSSGDESYPSMIINGLTGIVAYENEDNTRIYLRNTNDYGKHWSNEVQLFVYYSPSEPNIAALYPDISFSPSNNKAYGTYISPKNDYAVHGFFITPEIGGDLTNTVTYTLDWSDYKFYDFKNSEIVTYENSTTPWIITFIGSTDWADPNGLGPCKNSTMFCFNDLVEPQYISIVWFPEIQNCSNLTLASEFGSQYIYGACEIQNGNYKEILFFKGNPHDWYYESEFINDTWSASFADLKHPQISVDGNNIYIVAEKEKDGLHEILLRHSKTGGSGWLTKTIVTNHVPTADFKMSSVHHDAYFIDESADEDGYITSWLWDFGDGNTSILQNPHHLYGASGDYSVSLTVTDDDNTDSIISRIINVDNTTPIANFTIFPLHPELYTSFTDTSIQYENYTIDNWTWDFGDGSNDSYIQNPGHAYETDGKYLVSLSVKNETMNKTGSIQKIIEVGFIADFTFEPAYPLMNDIIWFNDTSSTIDEKNIIEWKWDFGDGSGPYINQNMTHQYPRPDVYQVTLTVKDDFLDTRTVQKNITVRPYQLIPSYPRIYPSGNVLYCIYSEGKNIIMVNSTNSGNSWSQPIVLNSLKGTVVEEYHNSFIPDNDHVVWVDDREGNKDIYSISKTTPTIDLRIIPGSVEITREDFPFLQSSNRIKFTVENRGATFVEDIRVIVTIEFNEDLNKDPINTSYPGYIYRLDGGAKKTFDKPLFRLTLLEFIGALMDYAGIIDIAVTVDPDKKYNDSNTGDNIYRIPITYSMMFPMLSFLENIFL